MPKDKNGVRIITSNKPRPNQRVVCKAILPPAKLAPPTKGTLAYTRVPKPLRREILSRTHCHYCKKAVPRESRTVDHRVPRCQGGGNEPENLCMACLECNSRKAELTEAEFLNYLAYIKSMG